MKNVRLVSRSERKGKSQGLLAGLNPKQREACNKIDGPMLILAGAGSGKTRALTYRLAYLIEQGVPASNILALTFTNKAAREMKARIADLVGAEQAQRVWAGTFHSIFARILRREAELLGYTRSFSIHDGEDSLNQIRAVMTDLGISQQDFTPQAVRGAVSKAKNSLLSWQEYQRQADSVFEQQVGLVYKEYVNRMRRSNAMDFDDILLNMIALLRSDPAILARYSRQFHYILVDEYQDTNHAQYMSIQMLAKEHRNICVVGDDAQSIYRWRGADIRNILQFEKDFTDTSVVRLEQNYRSTKTILAAANDVIQHNVRQLKKELWTDNDAGDPVYLRRCYDDREEAAAVVDTIKREISGKGLKYKDFAVLYRINAQSQALEDAFRRSNIPYVIIGGMSFYKRKEVKDALAYLRLLVNPSDNESFLRVVNEPARGIGKTSLQRIAAYANDRDLSLFDACRSIESVPNLQKRARTAALDFVSWVARFTETLAEMPMDEVVKNYLEASGLPRMYQEAHGDDAFDRYNNVQRILSHVTEYSRENAEPTLTDYLQEVALIDDAEDAQDQDKIVTMMTMHGAKGLEFPTVFIVGMEQGLFPLARAEKEPEELEEERRLFYVAITRAEQRLYLSYTQRRYRFGELSYPQPSYFLGEIGKDKIEELGRSQAAASERPSRGRGSRQATRPSSTASAGTTSKTSYFDDIKPDEDQTYSQIPEEQNRSRLRSGLRVHHSKFGEGKVLNVAGSGDQRRARVRFAGVGEKTLMLKYARLEVLGD